MPRLTWGTVGERYYESGVDQGVLYPELGPGVAWFGITSIQEAPTGGDPKPFYVDGYKYLNTTSSEEFTARIEAFFAPAEFGECDGTQQISNGLFITQQRRKTFGLSYRTRIGNDLDGANHAYKIHLVYNALAAPSARNFSSIGESVEPSMFSWDISTLPPRLSGRKASAHFVIDSRFTPPTLMSNVEDILYGSDLEDSRLPSVSEIIELFDNYSEVL